MAFKDKLLYEFLQKDYGDPFKHNKDPNEYKYKSPDFGFDNDMTFEENDGNVSRWWRYFLDLLQNQFPKFERIKNYIDFVNETNMSEELKKMPGGRGSILKPNKGGSFNFAEYSKLKE